MKLAALFATVALAQDSIGDGRAMSLQKKIDNAGETCSVYMEKAMVCAPDKIGKYNFRLEKVLKDAQHHLKVGKCDVDSGYGKGGYRRRRDTEEELDRDSTGSYSDYVYAILKQVQLKKYDFTTSWMTQSALVENAVLDSFVNMMESLCSKSINLALADDSLATCGKLVAWQKQADDIFDDMVRMKNVCIKQKNADA